MNSFRLTVNHKIVSARPGETVREALNRNSIKIHQSCDGHATCGTCLIKVALHDVPRLPDKEGLELEMSMERGFTEQERLSCQLVLNSDLEIILKENL